MNPRQEGQHWMMHKPPNYDPDLYRCGDGSWIDLTRSTWVGNVGLCSVLTDDGQVVPVLIDVRVADTPAPCQPDDWRDVAPHELTGSLPYSWARSRGLHDRRCGAPNAHGRPCKLKVRNSGDRCGFHEHASPIKAR